MRFCRRSSSPLPPELPRWDWIRYRPQPPLRLPYFFFQHLPLLAYWPVTVPGERSGKPLPDKLLVDQGTTHPDKSDGSTISISRHRFYPNDLAEDQCAGRLLRLGPEILTLLGAVDTPQAYPFLPAVVEHSDAVAVDDSDNLTGLGPGERWGQSDADHDNQPWEVSFHELTL
jgi:hypothetical protein